MWVASDGVATFAFVQLLFADIVVSFTFEIRVGCAPCLFLHCADGAFVLHGRHWDPGPGFCRDQPFLSSGCRVLFVHTHTLPSYTRPHLCLLACVHFHFISVIAKLFVLNIFFSEHLFHFEALCRCCWFLHFAKAVCCCYFWCFMRRGHYCSCFLYCTSTSIKIAAFPYRYFAHSTRLASPRLRLICCGLLTAECAWASGKQIDMQLNVSHKHLL